MTASGAPLFEDAPAIGEPLQTADRFPYGPTFFRAVHLATLTGIARAAAGEVAQAVRERNRTYSHAAGARPSADPHVLQVVGRVHGLDYAAGATTV